MLGKLLKHELKQSARYVMTVYACAGVAAVLMLLAMLADITFLNVLCSVALMVIGFTAVIMTLVSVIKNFYDSLYGAQGYLSFTLPVKCSSLLLSKVLVSFFWIILSGLLMCAIYALLFFNARAQTEDVLDGVLEAIRQSGLMSILPSWKIMLELICVLVLTALMNILVFVGFVYFSVTLANTRALQKHPKLFGFLIFFASYGITNSLSAKITYSFPLAVHVTTQELYVSFEAMDTMGSSIMSFGLGGTVFMALIALGLLFACGWIMEHKVNIK